MRLRMATAASNYGSEGLLDDDYDNMARAPSAGGPLFDSNLLKKKMEQDAFLLANRIRSLKMAQAKTGRNIRETEKRTAEIEDLQRQKEERRRQKEFEKLCKDCGEQETREQQAERREEENRRKQNKLDSVRSRNNEAGNFLKAERRRLNASRERQENEFLAKAATKREAIRGQFTDLTASRERAKEERVQMAHFHVEQRLMDDEEERRANDRWVGDMEAEERTLIEGLQNSQRMHLESFARLENVLASGYGGGSCSSSRSMAPADQRANAPRPAGLPR